MNITTEQLVNQVINNAQVGLYNNELIMNLTDQNILLSEHNSEFVNQIIQLNTWIVILIISFVVFFFVFVYFYNEQNKKINEFSKKKEDESKDI